MLVVLLIGAAVVALVCLVVFVGVARARARRLGRASATRADADSTRAEPSRSSAPLPLPPGSDEAAPAQARATKYPVVLVHGLLGFDELSVAGTHWPYFRDVPEQLRAAGAEVHVVRISSVAGVAVRARELAATIRALDAPRVNVVAHSMGGLDARFAVSTFGLADRVASVITIGTPHRGTPLADAGVQWLERSAFLARRLGVGRDRDVTVQFEAVRDLSTARMEAFNRFVPDVAGVFYGSCVAIARGGARGVSAALLPTVLFLARHGEDSDGLVPAASQRWGEVLAEIDVDHWGQTGWSSRFDAGAFYRHLLQLLAARGL